MTISLLEQILAYCKRNNISKRTFGLRVCGDARLVEDMERGRRIRNDLRRRMWDYMMFNPAGGPVIVDCPTERMFDLANRATQSSILGSRMLLKRQLETGMHWITDPEKYRKTWESLKGSIDGD